MKTLDCIGNLAIELISKTYTVNPQGYREPIQVNIAKQLGYSFKFNTRKNSAGVCSYRKKTIELSKEVMKLNLNNEDFIRDTILHEIAHAIAGQGTGHNHIWKRVAKQIGCSAERCFDTSLVSDMESKYTNTCIVCGNKTPMHRKTKTKSSCGKCCPKYFNEKYILELTQNY